MTRRLARVMLGPKLGDAGMETVDAVPAATVIALMAGVSFVAGLIHIRASIDHADEFLLYTPVFALLAALQIGWAVWVTRASSRRVLLCGGALNLAIIGLWVASRTIGVPIAEQPWVPEAVGAPDLMATVAESVIVLGTACMLMALQSPVAQRVLARLAPVLLVVTFLSVLYGLGGGHAG